MAQGQDTGGAGGGLSTGAQVGIGIGGALVAIAIGLGLFAFFSRRRRGTIEAAEKLAASSNENTDVYHARQELEAGPNTRMETDAADVSRGAAGSDVRFETEGDSEWLPQELDSSGAPLEVDSVQLAAEMPASPARVEPNGRVRFGRRLRGSREPT